MENVNIEAVEATRKETNRLPRSTLMTASSESGSPEGDLPNPLIRVASGSLIIADVRTVQSHEKRPTVMPTHTAPTTVCARTWYQSAKVMTVLSIRVLASGLDHQRRHGVLTIVNIVQLRMRIMRIVDNEGPAQTIAVLSRQMAVIPEGAGLIWYIKVVKERVFTGDGALRDECGTISPVSSLLEEPMPMLMSFQ